MFNEKTHAFRGVVNDMALTDYAEQLPVGVHICYTSTGQDINIVGQPVDNVGLSYLINKVAHNAINIIAFRFTSNEIYLKQRFNNSTWSAWRQIPTSVIGGGVTNVLPFPAFLKGVA